MNERARASLLTRYLVFAVGVVIMSFGVALSVRASLGTAPISTLPTVLSFTGIGTVGSLTIIMNAVFVVLQIALLRRRYRWIQLLQLPAATLFGVAIDGSLWLLRDVAPSEYWQQALLTIVGTIVLSIGVWIEVTPRVLMVPGEGLVQAIADVTHRRFGNIKVAFDVTLVTLATIVSLILFHGLVGVREGTVFGALTVGNFVKLWQRLFPGLGRWVTPHPPEHPEHPADLAPTHPAS
ncbi:YczE/YyaS/YitT family protein [Gulosibacter sp. ACHW.36C]|uniref:DUF6198 family protein n=1 Tax=Gulosibacter sediminis TaxID=1729695 RepID=A0ABY4MZE5_9MICO|nr:DUF6198 family protein [Gulosibacter sediminis]UQN14756.1 DUF6198 family protein [Gulosibacter sediminis]